MNAQDSTNHASVWHSVGQRILEIVRSDHEHLTDLRWRNPDCLLEAAKGSTSTRLTTEIWPDIWRHNDANQDDWRQWNNEAVLTRLFAQQPWTQGKVWLVNDTFADSIPVLITTEGFDDFEEATLDFDLHDDTIIVWVDEPRISLVHHEGLGAHIWRDTEAPDGGRQ